VARNSLADQRPDHWARHNWISFDGSAASTGSERPRQADRVDLPNRTVSVERADGSRWPSRTTRSSSPRVTNGFWRQPTLQSADDIGADLRAAHDRLAAATSVIVSVVALRRSAVRPTSR